MNEYPKNSNVIIKEQTKVDYLERKFHVAKTVESTTFDNDDR